MPIDMSRYMAQDSTPTMSDGALDSDTAMQVLRNIVDLGGWISKQPLVRGTMTVLDTPGRTARGAIAGKNPITEGALDPEGDDDRTEEQLDKYVVPHFPAAAAPGSPARGIAKFLYDTGTDPTTIIPGADVVSIGKRIAKYIGAGAKATGIADKISGAASAVGNAAAKRAPDAVQATANAVENAKQTFSTSHVARQNVSQTALNDIRAAEANENVTRGALGAKYADKYAELQAKADAEDAAWNAAHPNETQHGTLIVPPSRAKRAAALPADQPNRVAELDDELRTLPVQQYLDAAKKNPRPLKTIGANSTDLRDPAVRALLSPASQQTLADANAFTDAIGWRLGSARARGQMIQRGYMPTDEERGLPLLNLIDKDHGVGYLPEREALGEGVDEQAKIAGQYDVKPQGQARSPYDNAKGAGTYAVSSLTDRLAQYANSAAYLEAKRGRDLDLYDKLGIVPTQQARTRARLADAQRNADDNLAQYVLDKSDRTPSAAFSDAALVRANNSLRRVDRYKALLGRQDAQEAQNAATRAAAFMPDAPVHEGAIPDVLRSEGDMLGAARRDVDTAGRDASPMMRDGRYDGAIANTGLAFDRFGNLLPDVSTTKTEDTLTRQGAVLREQTKGANLARRALIKTQGRDAANTQAFQEALTAGQRILKAQGEKGYDAAITSDRRLTDALKKYEGLSEQREFGYARSGGGIRDNYDPIIETLLTRSGQGVRATIDPVFNATLKATTKDYVAKPFQPAAAAIDKAQIKRRDVTAPVQGLADTFDTKRVAQANKIFGTLERLGGIRDKNAAIGAVQDAAQNDVFNSGKVEGLPEYVFDRLHGQRVRQEPNAMEMLGGIKARALYSLPFGHGSNVAQQTVFAGGKQGGLRTSIAGVGRSLRMARGDAQAIAERDAVKRVGGIAPHGYEDAVAPKTTIGKIIDAGQRGLTNFHEGQATELFQREVRAGMRPEDAAQAVRDTFGNTLETSVAARAKQGVGSAFARWVLSTLPSTLKKIATDPVNRKRALLAARGVNAANTEYFEPNYGVDFHPGGTLERAATMLFSPAKYFTGSSMQGSIESAGDDAKHGALDSLKGLVPFLGPAMDLVDQPLSDRGRRIRGADELPLPLRLPALLGSYYTASESPGDKRRRENIRLGIKR